LAIRIIAYDGGQSKSLLSQLGMKGIFFTSYATKNFPGNLVASHPLIMLRLDGGGASFVPVLANGPNQQKL